MLLWRWNHRVTLRCICTVRTCPSHFTVPYTCHFVLLYVLVCIVTIYIYRACNMIIMHIYIYILEMLSDMISSLY